jgi:predicted  nucleic acid-binding Zn-ribbon protein
MAEGITYDIFANDQASDVVQRVGKVSAATANKITAANLKVERATNALTKAQEKFGRESLEAREAANKLAAAQLKVDAAARKAKDEIEESGKEAEKAADSFEDAADAIEHFDFEAREASDSAERLSGAVRGLGKASAAAALGAVKLGAGAAAVGSLAIPAAFAVGKAAIAAGQFAASAGQFAATVAPAAAALLPLRIGVLAVTQTLKAAGPAMLESIQPVTDAWERQTERIGELASKGLRPLSREFLKVNFDTVRETTDRIAKSTNEVVVNLGKWANSTEGVDILARLGTGISSTFERLAPKAEQVAKAVARLAGRASGTAFREFGNAAEWAADRVTGLLDSISEADIQVAFDTIYYTADRAAAGVREFARNVGDAAAWLEQHEDAIQRVRTALAGLAIAGGLATGGWLIALGGAVSLATLNWDAFSEAGRRAGARLREVGENTAVQGSLTALGNAWDRVASGAEAFADRVGPKLGPTLDSLEDSFVRLQPHITAFAAVAGPAAEGWLKFAGVMTGAWLAVGSAVANVLSHISLGATATGKLVLDAFITMFGPIADAAQKLNLPFADSFQRIVGEARLASDRVNRSMQDVRTDLARNEMERLQDKVRSLKGKTIKTEADKQAIAASQARIRELQKTINSLEGKEVGVRIVHTTEYRSYRSGERGDFPGRAVGGPVSAGMPYWVGERRRPELFVPGQSGQIMTESQVARSPLGRGRRTVVYNVTLNAPNYVGDKSDLVRALDDLRRAGRLPKAS